MLVVEDCCVIEVDVMLCGVVEVVVVCDVGFLCGFYECEV